MSTAGAERAGLRLGRPWWRWPDGRGGALGGYCVNASIGWPLAAPALVWSLVVDFASRGRSWAGDWVMAMTWAGSPLVFVAVVAAGVAAYDAGQSQTGERAGVVDSYPGRAREVLRVWVGASAPFALVHLLSVALVVMALVADGAPRGQVVAPLAQQLVVLAFATALGMVVGVVCGPRLGAFVALVLAAYLVYWRGYVSLDDTPPTRIIVATTGLVGYKLSEPLVAIQVAGALVWVIAALVLVVFSLPDQQGQRRPRVAAIMVTVAVVGATGWLTPRVTKGWVDPVPTAVSRRCTGGPVEVCLYVGHDRERAQVTLFAARVRATAAREGLADLFPTRILERRPSGPAAGQLWLLPDDLGRARVAPDTLAMAMLPGQNCPQLQTDWLTAAADAFIGTMPAARQTVKNLAEGRPASQWPMTPQRLRTYVEGARTCDLQAAVGAR